MRPLEFADLYKAQRVLKAAHFSDEIKPLLAMAAENAGDLRRVGFKAIFTTLDLLAENEAEVKMYDFLAGPFEMDPEEVRHLKLDELKEKVEWLLNEESTAPFFKSLFDGLGQS